MAINNYIKWPAERIRQDENNRLISDVQITTWNGKADSDHNHDDKYISLKGTDALTGNIVPTKTGQYVLGYPHKQFNMISSLSFLLQMIQENGMFKSIHLMVLCLIAEIRLVIMDVLI